MTNEVYTENQKDVAQLHPTSNSPTISTATECHNQQQLQ